MAASEAQKRANQKWRSHHKDKQQIYNHRSTAKRFVKLYANSHDLDVLDEMIKERRSELEKLG